NIKSEKQFGIIPSYIIAHYISGSLKSPFNSADIIDFFEVSKMAASRAIKELIQLNIISELDSGKFKRYEFNFSRRSLWIKHKHQIAKLATDFIPVPKSKINSLDVFLSGETALADYTMLSPPNVEYVAICMSAKERYLRPITPATIEGNYLFKAMGLVDDNYAYELNKINYVMLQVYPYVPLINSKVLGKVFLALSRGNRHDVRIRSSFDELESEILTELND
ncbi:hypothetical protein QUP77_003616, partial [Escherichia coli]|nr:hypothetical protein [Escherichia coli]